MTSAEKKLTRDILTDWKQNISSTEWTFHQLSPYIGKIKSSVAASLIRNFTNPGDTIYDPYCGAGTIPLEAWINHRSVVANDLNIYAFTLVSAKLNPPKNLERLLNQIQIYGEQVKQEKKNVDLRKVPQWVKSFFHNETLREIICWVSILQREKEYFLLASLMGILHHQRPGFLSYPSSHTVPYLRIKKFPREIYPDLYEYRTVVDRLAKKVIRAYKRIPKLDYRITRTCVSNDAAVFCPKRKVDAIITSPPYMRQLDYARDNRLRLWFLGVTDFKDLDKTISPTEKEFIESIRKALSTWADNLKSGGKCILILGDSKSKMYNMKLPDMIEKIAVEELGFYDLLIRCQSIIPEKSRVRKNHLGSKRETVLILKRK